MAGLIDKQFCKACGREIPSGTDEESVEIRFGNLQRIENNKKKRPGRPKKKTDGQFRSSFIWGYLHKDCFRMSFGSADDVFNLIKNSKNEK